jgi:hypothetical protein
VRRSLNFQLCDVKDKGEHARLLLRVFSFQVLHLVGIARRLAAAASAATAMMATTTSAMTAATTLHLVAIVRCHARVAILSGGRGIGESRGANQQCEHERDH